MKQRTPIVGVVTTNVTGVLLTTAPEPIVCDATAVNVTFSDSCSMAVAE